MNAQETLKQNYHLYLAMVEALPKEMREHGVFRLEVMVEEGKSLDFSHEGTVKIYDNDKIYPVTSIDEIIGKCFDYSIIIRNLEQVVPEHMAKVVLAVDKARKSLDDFNFYKK